MKKKAKVVFYYSGSDEETCILLGKRAGSSGEEFWWLPGGSMEEGEDFLQALKRELSEELVMTDTLKKTIEKYNESNHPASITYSTEQSIVTVGLIPVTVMEEIIPTQEEFSVLHWFSIETLPYNMSREFTNIRPYITANFFKSLSK